MNPLWKFFTSLRLTIWVLGISVALVFLGSMAQVHEGLWNAQARWFKSWLVIRSAGDVWWVPPVFPGGHLLGTILLVNLLAAHARRFQWSFQKIGIQITHLGIVMLLVGQYLTDELAVESHMGFREGETKQFTEHHRDNELAFITDTPDGQERVISLPEARLADKSLAESKHPELPFVVRVKDYAVNADILQASIVLQRFGELTGALATVDGKYTGGDLTALAAEAAGVEGRAAVWRESLQAVGEKDVADLVAATQRVAADTVRAEKFRAEVKSRFRRAMLDANIRGRPADEQMLESRYAAEALDAGKTLDEASLPKGGSKGAGERFFSVRRPEQKDNDARNTPCAVVEIEDAGKSLGTWLVAPTLREQEFEAGGKKWRVALRFERFYVPYTLTLLKTNHDVYPGTEIPKDYRSRVLIENAATGEKRETEIYMNQPLRYAGLTFYQYQMGTDQRGTPVKTSTLQVVQNPSWLTPYAGCLVVGLGMMWQFLWHLSRFLAKRMGLPAPEVGCAHPLLPVAALAFVAPDLWVLGKGLADGSMMTAVAVACTLVLRVLIARQIWQGRYLGFAIVFLAVTTTLLVPFAIKYRGEYGMMLWPLVATQTFVIAAIVIAISGRKEVAA